MPLWTGVILGLDRVHSACEEGMRGMKGVRFVRGARSIKGAGSVKAHS